MQPTDRRLVTEARMGLMLDNSIGSKPFVFTDPNTPRPDTPQSIIWKGPSLPFNMAPNDDWWRVALVPVVPEVDWLHFWSAADLAASADDASPVSAWTSFGSVPNIMSAISGQEPTLYHAAGAQPAFIDIVRTSSSVGDYLKSEASPDNQPVTVVCMFRNDALVTDPSNTTRRRIYGGIDASFNINLDQMGNGSSVAAYRASNAAQTGFHETAVANTDWTFAMHQSFGAETLVHINGVEDVIQTISTSQRTSGYALGGNTTGTSNFWDGKIEQFGVVAGPIDDVLLTYEATMLARAASWV